MVATLLTSHPTTLAPLPALLLGHLFLRSIRSIVHLPVRGTIAMLLFRGPNKLQLLRFPFCHLAFVGRLQWLPRAEGLNLKARECDSTKVVVQESFCCHGYDRSDQSEHGDCIVLYLFLGMCIHSQRQETEQVMKVNL